MRVARQQRSRARDAPVCSRWTLQVGAEGLERRPGGRRRMEASSVCSWIRRRLSQPRDDDPHDPTSRSQPFLPATRTSPSVPIPFRTTMTTMTSTSSLPRSKSSSSRALRLLPRRSLDSSTHPSLRPDALIQESNDRASMRSTTNLKFPPSSSFDPRDLPLCRSTRPRTPSTFLHLLDSSPLRNCRRTTEWIPSLPVRQSSEPRLPRR